MGMNARYLRPRLAFKPRTLYFFSNTSLGIARSQTWTELGNWYTNNDATVQATALPRSNDAVIIRGIVGYTGLPSGSRPVVQSLTATGIFSIPIYVRGSATFSNEIGSTIFGQVIEAGVSINVIAFGYNMTTLRAPLVRFDIDGAYNYGTVQATLTQFFGAGFNDGAIYGNAEFYSFTQNTEGGLIFGNAWFYDNSEHYGDVTGTATFNDQSNNYGTAGFFVCNTTGIC